MCQSYRLPGVPSSLKNYRPLTFFAIVLMAATVCSPSLAQTTGSIVGKAIDPAGALVAGGTVTATNQATGFSRTTATGPSGEYVLSLLPVGRYTVTADKQGFAPYKLADVVVNLNENVRVDIAFTMGKVAEELSVHAGGVAEVETRSATVGKVVDERKIVDLPLNGRNS